MAGLSLVTAPTMLPISTAEAAEHLRVDGTSDEAIILSCVRAATEQAEAITKRKLMRQTWKYTLDCIPDAQWIELPFAPLASVTHFKYYDTGGTQQTWSSVLYDVDTLSEPGRISPIWGETWPSYRDKTNSIEIQFLCGWVSPAAIPESIKQAIKLLCGHYYENREAVGFLQPSQLPMGVYSLLGSYEVARAF